MPNRSYSPPQKTDLPPSERFRKKRRNRRRRNWHQAVRRVGGVILLIELLILLFANPALEVTKVRINGLQTLSTQQVFDEAGVPAHRNIFLMALRNHFAQRLEKNPVIDQASVSLSLPHTLVLNVTERQPYAQMEMADTDGGESYWTLDNKGVPFLVSAAPSAGLPVLQWQGAPSAVTLGKAVPDPRLKNAYHLLTLLHGSPNLEVEKIEVDQNSNLCLNSRNHLQIKLGQPKALPEKIALAQAALGADNGAFAQQIACLDLSSPQQPVYVPRALDAEMLTDPAGNNDRR